VTVQLSIENLCKRFGGVVASDSVSFELATGEHLAVIGPNGAGKSTLFKMIGGQLRADAGHIMFEGKNITKIGPRAVWRSGLAQTFQITATFSSFTVRENVQIALMSLHRQTGNLWTNAHELYRDEAQALIDTVGIGEFAERACGVLAYGDLKRVELAIALAARPRLLMMDEPTAGMAPAERRTLMDLVTRMAKRDGVAILFTEHDMDIVFGHADRVIVLDQGRVIAQGTPGAVRSNEKVKEIYLGSGAHA
jgi:branched-chain amino acid transport system ATP-binding protein